MAKAQGMVGRRILALLLGGAALALAGSPRRYGVIAREIRRELRAIEYEEIREAIKSLYRSKLVDFREDRKGSTTLILTEAGRRRALTYRVDEMQIVRPMRWDGKWRLVLFDIPERFKRGRDTLRQHLKQLGFVEFQRSVFVHPFECRDEIEFIIEFYQLRPWVRYAVAEMLDNAFHLRQKFRGVLAGVS